MKNYSNQTSGNVCQFPTITMTRHYSKVAIILYFIEFDLSGFQHISGHRLLPFPFSFFSWQKGRLGLLAEKSWGLGKDSILLGFCSGFAVIITQHCYCWRVWK
jgi:hypothetical protein